MRKRWQLRTMLRKPHIDVSCMSVRVCERASEINTTIKKTHFHSFKFRPSWMQKKQEKVYLLTVLRGQRGFVGSRDFEQCCMYSSMETPVQYLVEKWKQAFSAAPVPIVSFSPAAPVPVVSFSQTGGSGRPSSYFRQGELG